MSGPPYRCAHPLCPGYPYRASDMAHPAATCGAATLDKDRDPFTLPEPEVRALLQAVLAWRRQNAHVYPWSYDATSWLAKLADRLRDTYPALCAELENAEGAVHILSGGYAICGKPGVPQSWTDGSRWVRIEKVAQATCEECKRTAGDARKKVDELNQEREP